MEEEVVKGTQTLKNWKVGEQVNTAVSQPYQNNNFNNNGAYVINQFATQSATTGTWTRTPLNVGGRGDLGNELNVLKNF